MLISKIGTEPTYYLNINVTSNYSFILFTINAQQKYVHNYVHLISTIRRKGKGYCVVSN